MRTSHPRLVAVALIESAVIFLACAFAGDSYASTPEEDFRASLELQRGHTPYGAAGWGGAEHMAYVSRVRNGCADQSAPMHRLVLEPTLQAALRSRSGSLPRSPSGQVQLSTEVDFDRFVGAICGSLLSNGGSDLRNDAGSPKAALFCMLSEETVASIPADRAQARAMWPQVLSEASGGCADWLRTGPYKTTHAKLVENDQVRAAAAAKAAEQERLEELKRQEEQKHKQEQVENERRLAEQKQQALDRQIQSELTRLMQAAAVSQADAVVWQAGSPAPQAPYSSVSEMFNELNADLEQQLAFVAKGRAFTPPPKGEFETTEAYRARLAKLETEHAAQIRAEQRAATQRWTQTRVATYQKHLGVPTITAVAYNADSAVFRLTVTSSRSEYVLSLGLKMAVAQAAARKPALAAGMPIIVFSASGSAPVPKFGLVRTTDNVFVADVVSATPVPISFGQAAATNWIAAKQKIAEQRAVQERQDALRRAEAAKKRRIERTAKYDHAGPFLRQGAVVCSDFRSMVRAAAIERANNPYVDIPDGCLRVTDELVPVTDVEGLQAVGGLVKVVLKYGGVPAYSTASAIVE